MNKSSGQKGGNGQEFSETEYQNQKLLIDLQHYQIQLNAANDTLTVFNDIKNDLAQTQNWIRQSESARGDLQVKITQTSNDIIVLAQKNKNYQESILSESENLRSAIEEHKKKASLTQESNLKNINTLNELHAKRQQEYISEIEVLGERQKNQLSELTAQCDIETTAQKLMIERLIQQSEANNQTHAKQLESLQNKHAETLTSAETRHRSQLQDLSNELQARDQAYFNDLKQEQDDHTKKYSDLQNHHRETISIIQSQHSKVVADLLAQHRQTVAELQAQHSQTVADLNAVKSLEITSLQIKHREQLKKASEDVVRRDNQYINDLKTRQSEYESQTVALIAKYKIEIDALKAQLISKDTLLVNQQVEHTQRLTAAQTFFEEWQKKTHQEHFAKMSKLETEILMKVRVNKIQLSEAEKERESMRSSLQIKIDVLIKELNEQKSKDLISTSTIQALSDKLIVLQDVEKQLNISIQREAQMQSAKNELQVELENSAQHTNSLEQRFYESRKEALEYFRQLKEQQDACTQHEEEIETLRNYIIDLKSRIAVYIPVKNDAIDKKIAEYINNYPDRQKLKIMFMRESEGVYQFGTKRVGVKVDKDKINIRVGGGYLSIDEFLDQFTPTELGKLERKDPMRRFTERVAVTKTVQGRETSPVSPSKQSPSKKYQSFQ